MKIRSDGISWQELDGELVILDLQASVYLTTNKTGAFLAKLLTENRSPAELTDALVVAYGIDHDRASADASAFVRELERKGLLDKRVID